MSVKKADKKMPGAKGFEGMQTVKRFSKASLRAAHRQHILLFQKELLDKHDGLKSPGLKATQEFWDMHPCDGDFQTEELHLRFRYLKDYCIPPIIERHIPHGGTVLEIGCGQGADLALLAKHADWVTGIDVSNESVMRARGFLLYKGIKNAIVETANAEQLPFADNCFDAVYSYGVMHHAPDTQACINEAYRVLKPQGTAVIMLYRSWSPQYVVSKVLRGMTYPLRKVLATGLSRPWFKDSRIVQSLLGTAPAELFGVPFFRGYSFAQLKRMFASFQEVNVERYFTGFSRFSLMTPDSERLHRFWRRMEDCTQDTFGFFNVVIAKK